jgi:glyoxylase I family protein
MKLHHVAISVENAPTSLKWYETVLGLKLEREVHRRDQGVSVYFVGNEFMRLELFAFEACAKLPDYRRDVERDIRVCGTKHFALEVDDIAASIECARKAGSVIDGPHLSLDRGNLYAFVTDPSGILVEFMEFRRE